MVDYYWSSSLTMHACMQPTHVQLRDKKGRDGSTDRPFSHPPLNEDPESPPPLIQEKPLTRADRRRSSLPPAFLNEQMKKFQESRNRSKKGQTLPDLHEPRYSSQVSTEEEPEGCDVEHLNESHGPTFPYRGMSRNYSHGHALNQLRQDLKDKLHPPQAIQTAWRSNPGSRNPSRHGSRMPSSTLRHPPTQPSGLEELQDEEEPSIIFHSVKSKTLPRNFTSKKGSVSIDSADDVPHLPSLHISPPSRGGGRHMTADHMPTPRTNGFKLNSGEIFNISTDRSADNILSEILRVASNVKMRESERHGHFLNCSWKGIRFGINVHKQGAVCQLKFKWFSGGDFPSYKDLCEKFMRKLKLYWIATFLTIL